MSPSTRVYAQAKPIESLWVRFTSSASILFVPIVADVRSSFCVAHAGSEAADSQNLERTLTEDACEFQNAQDINHSLGALYTLLAQGRISPRRASVLAYISNLLLRSLTAIDKDYCAQAGRPDVDSYQSAQADNEPPGDDLIDEQHRSGNQAPAASPATARQCIPPGTDPLPATAQEFAAAVLKRQKPN
jgi:hypothetical protein